MVRILFSCFVLIVMLGCAYNNNTGQIVNSKIELMNVELIDKKGDTYMNFYKQDRYLKTLKSQDGIVKVFEGGFTQENDLLELKDYYGIYQFRLRQEETTIVMENLGNKVSTVFDINQVPTKSIDNTEWKFGIRENNYIDFMSISGWKVIPAKFSFGKDTVEIQLVNEKKMRYNYYYIEAKNIVIIENNLQNPYIVSLKNVANNNVFSFYGTPNTFYDVEGSILK